VSWYDSLAKPSWTPASSVIGTVWAVLYPVIFVTYGYVIFRVVRGEIPWHVTVPIAINLAANLAFTPIQFGLQNLALASVDILVVLASLIWSIVAIWPYAPWASITLTPYLVWVAIATTLQLSITWMNR